MKKQKGSLRRYDLQKTRTDFFVHQRKEEDQESSHRPSTGPELEAIVLEDPVTSSCIVSECKYCRCRGLRVWVFIKASTQWTLVVSPMKRRYLMKRGHARCTTSSVLIPHSFYQARWSTEGCNVFNSRECKPAAGSRTYSSRPENCGGFCIPSVLFCTSVQQRRDKSKPADHLPDGD